MFWFTGKWNLPPHSQRSLKASCEGISPRRAAKVYRMVLKSEWKGADPRKVGTGTGTVPKDGNESPARAELRKLSRAVLVQVPLIL